jgi:hypothetical protein
MRFVLVSGTVVVDGGKVVDGVFPGRALVGDRRSPR